MEEEQTQPEGGEEKPTEEPKPEGETTEGQ